VVVWQSYPQDGSDYGVFGQRFASSGAPQGTEFQVNTYTTSDQNAPAVASAATGNFVAVWASEHQDGSEDGVFGQRYVVLGATPAPTLSWRVLGVLALALVGFGGRVLRRRRRV